MDNSSIAECKKQITDYILRVIPDILHEPVHPNITPNLQHIIRSLQAKIWSYIQTTDMKGFLALVILYLTS